jgi:hypothetical protein
MHLPDFFFGGNFQIYYAGPGKGKKKRRCFAGSAVSVFLLDSVFDQVVHYGRVSQG